jgi:hypothetical protein
LFLVVFCFSRYDGWKPRVQNIAADDFYSLQRIFYFNGFFLVTCGHRIECNAHELLKIQEQSRKIIWIVDRSEIFYVNYRI